MNRIKSLDGIRGIAILMVLLGHSVGSLPAFIQTSFIYQVISNGHTGVLIFFVISGYLITKLLISERERNGDISIKNFYLRRFFRIFPILYIYVGTVVILKNTVAPALFSDYKSVLFALLYFWNYKHLIVGTSYHESNPGYWYFGHLWSLSMEEQFYLLFPLAFKKININLLKKLIIITVAIMPVVRVMTYFFMPNSRGQIGMMLHTGGDSILVGCLFAILEKSNAFIAYMYRLWNTRIVVILCFLFVFVIDLFLTHTFAGAYAITVGMTINNFVIAFLLLWCVYTSSAVSTFLNSKILKQIGLISYSLYIWQQLVLGSTYRISFPLNVAMVFSIGFISYYFVEKPILKLKNRFEPMRKTISSSIPA